MRVKMSKQPPPAPTASTVGPCPTVNRIVGRPGTGSLPSTIAQPDHPRTCSIHSHKKNKASQAIQSPRTVLLFLLMSLLDVYSLANVHVKVIVAFKHLK